MAQIYLWFERNWNDDHGVITKIPTLFLWIKTICCQPARQITTGNELKIGMNQSRRNI